MNADKPDRWKSDVARSVDFYNAWFMRFAPEAYRSARANAARDVRGALKHTDYLRNITPDVLRANPSILPMLRMATAPPIARDRLIGLSKVTSAVVLNMEHRGRLPPRMLSAKLDAELQKIGQTISSLADRDIFSWLESGHKPSPTELRRAAAIVADRVCGAASDPIIRNAQERRQLDALRLWLETRGYTPVETREGLGLDRFAPGTYSFRFNVPVVLEDGITRINITVDAVVMPRAASRGDFPLLIEAKSAGDFTNTNKRRKEEAVKIAQLRRTYGGHVRFILFLCGYFDSSYLGYEAAEGIDWVWEHRIDDLAECGL